MLTRWLSRLAAAAVLLNLAGCATPGLIKSSKDDYPIAGPKNPVIRILGMWEPAEGTVLNKTMRGFSAQILFFSQKSDLAAKVDGDVQIFVFDDQGTSEEQAVPFQQCKYDAGAWNTHMGKGPLGATYVVFVPYTPKGTHEARCALRIRYTPKQGPVVNSDMATVVLPGTKKRKDKESDDGESADAIDPGLDPEAFREFGHKVSKQQPPTTRGIAIPTPQDVQEQLHARHKVPAVELNTQERRRIMRDAIARLEPGENSSRVTQAAYEEPESDVPVAKDVPSGRRLRQPQPDAAASLDAGEADEVETVAPAAKREKRHVLDEEE